MGFATQVDRWNEDASGITSRLVLDYVERQGGRRAVERVLERAGAMELEPLLRDESYWLSFDLKVRLYHAAAEILDDPQVMRRVGEAALDTSVAQGLKLALRALGSPRIVYQNIVRANARFTRSHSMELLEARRGCARIRFTDLADRPFEPMDCDYSMGLLSCVPGLFGLPHARVGHPECMRDGAEACIYELTWDESGRYARFVAGCAGAGAAATAAGLLLTPLALPLTAVPAALAVRRVRAARRARWRLLEMELAAERAMTERLFSSIQELVSELRLEGLAAKVTENAQAAASGKDFVLLVEEDGRVAGQTPAPVTRGALSRLEDWCERSEQLTTREVLVDDVRTVANLRPLAVGGHNSLCAAPLLSGGRRLGVLVGLSHQPRSFLPRDIDLVKWYAAQAAIAITNARLYQAKQELASRDPLTGLLNLREFHETLERELARSARGGDRTTVALFDLDRFKDVNDRGGHAEGDRVLRRVGEAIAAACRRGDTPFRIGGDEFAVLLPSTDHADAEAAASRIREAIVQSEPRTGACFGIATWPEDGGSKDVLLAEADARLYAMKRLGGLPRAAGE